MRRESDRIRNPVMNIALKELLVPSIIMSMNRGVETGRPDTLFLTPIWPLWIEFKWGVLQPDPKQEYWHGVLRGLGYDVQVHNSTEAALIAIAAKVVAASVHAAGGEISAGAWRGDPDARSRLTENLNYARCVQFLEKAGSRAEDACYRAFESLLQSMAR